MKRSITPPAVSLLFLLQVLHCQEIALDRYAKRVTTLKTAFTGGISEAAEVGVGLSHLTDRLNGVCGCYIVWEYATNLLTITVSVFFGSNMAKLQTADNFEYVFNWKNHCLAYSLIMH